MKESNYIALKIVLDRCLAPLNKKNKELSTTLFTIVNKVRVFPSLVHYRIHVGFCRYINTDLYKITKYSLKYYKEFESIITELDNYILKYTSGTVSLEEKNRVVYNILRSHDGLLVNKLGNNYIKIGVMEELAKGFNKEYYSHFKGLNLLNTKVLANKPLCDRNIQWSMSKEINYLINKIYFIKKSIKEKEDYITYLLFLCADFPNRKVKHKVVTRADPIKLYPYNYTSKDSKLYETEIKLVLDYEYINKYFDFLDTIKHINYIPKIISHLNVKKIISKYKPSKMDNKKLKKTLMCLIKVLSFSPMLIFEVFAKTKKLNNVNTKLSLKLVHTIRSIILGSQYNVILRWYSLIVNLLVPKQYHKHYFIFNDGSCIINPSNKVSWLEVPKLWPNSNVKILEYLNNYHPIKHQDKLVLVGHVRKLLALNTILKKQKHRITLFDVIFKLLDKNKWFLLQHTYFHNAIKDKIDEFSKSKYKEVVNNF